MSDSRPLDNFMDITLDRIKQMVDVNTIVGDMITTPDGTVLIPVSKVTYGFTAGGSDLPNKKVESKDMFAGGSGAGVSITPIAFISVYKGEAKLLSINQYDNPTDRVVGMIPDIFDKVSGLIDKKKGNGKPKINTDRADDLSETSFDD